MGTRVHALVITPELTAIARHARAVRVFVYDLPSKLHPSLETFAPDSQLCRKSGTASAWHTFGIDLCNHGHGVAVIGSSPLAAAYQGNVWSNHEGGHAIAPIMHARLATSARREHNPVKAHTFFIPFYTRQITKAHKFYGHYMQYGVDFSEYQDYAAFWAWMLEQPSFQNSDGSDHFMVLSIAVHGSVRYTLLRVALPLLLPFHIALVCWRVASCY